MFAVLGIDCCGTEWKFGQRFATSEAAQQFIDDFILLPAWRHVSIETVPQETATEDDDETIVIADVDLCAV